MYNIPTFYTTERGLSTPLIKDCLLNLAAYQPAILPVVIPENVASILNDLVSYKNIYNSLNQDIFDCIS